MLNKAKEVAVEAAGTAREAAENHKYTKLVAKYGQEGAEAIIRPQLHERGLTVEEFRTYRKVKGVIQKKGLDVTAARKEAEQAAKGALDDELGLPA